MGTTPHSDISETKASEFNKNLRIVDGSTQSNSEIAISSLRSFLKLNATGDVSTIPATDSNISLSDMKNTWFPGARLRVQNEDTNTYSTYNNGVVAVSPFPGSDTNNNTGYGVDYMISMGDTSVLWNGVPLPGNIETDIGATNATARFSSSNVPGTVQSSGSVIEWEFDNTGVAGNGVSLSGEGNVYGIYTDTLTLSSPGGSTSQWTLTATLETPTDPVEAFQTSTYTTTADTTPATLFETLLPASLSAGGWYGPTKFADADEIAFYIQISGVQDFSPQYDSIYTSYTIPSGTDIILSGGEEGLTVSQLAAQYNSSPGAATTGNIVVIQGADFIPLNAQLDDDGNETEWSAIMTAGGGSTTTGDPRGNYVYFGSTSGPSAKSYHVSKGISAGTYYTVSLSATNSNMSVYPATFQVSVGYGDSNNAGLKWGGDTVARSITGWTESYRTSNLSTPVIVPNKRITGGDSVDTLTLSGDSVHS